MNPVAVTVLELLAAYCIDEEDAALPQALSLLTGSAKVCDVDSLMSGLHALKAQRAEPLRLALAERQLRAALGLPMHAGAICRPTLLP